MKGEGQMDEKKITGADVIRAVRQLAAENPDKVYRRPEGAVRCSYLTDVSGELGCGCIVGQALERCGVVLDGDEDNGHGPDIVMGMHDVNFDQEEAWWLTEVQSWQDGTSWAPGETWGKAVAHADDTYPELAPAETV